MKRHARLNFLMLPATLSNPTCSHCGVETSLQSFQSGGTEVDPNLGNLQVEAQEKVGFRVSLFQVISELLRLRTPVQVCLA